MYNSIVHRETHATVLRQNELNSRKFRNLSDLLGTFYSTASMTKPYQYSIIPERYVNFIWKLLKNIIVAFDNLKGMNFLEYRAYFAEYYKTFKIYEIRLSVAIDLSKSLEDLSIIVRELVDVPKIPDDAFRGLLYAYGDAMENISPCAPLDIRAIKFYVEIMKNAISVMNGAAEYFREADVPMTYIKEREGNIFLKSSKSSKSSDITLERSALEISKNMAAIFEEMSEGLVKYRKILENMIVIAPNGTLAVDTSDYVKSEFLIFYSHYMAANHILYAFTYRDEYFADIFPMIYPGAMYDVMLSVELGRSLFAAV